MSVKIGKLKIDTNSKHPSEETLKIKRSKGSATGIFHIIIYRDIDTRQIVMYIPSFDISGYGATREKASEMLKFSLDDYFHMLLSMSEISMLDTLRKLGWGKRKFSTKEFSKAYIDGDGNLQNFNAVGGEVEEATLVC